MISSRALVGKSRSDKASAGSTSKAKPSISPAEIHATNSSSPSYSFGDLPLYDREGDRRQIRHPFRLPWPVQAKLEVGAPDDPLEHEADTFADRTMRMPDAPNARTSVSPVGSRVQRKCSCGGTCDKCKSEDDDKNGQLQKKSVGTARPKRDSVPPSVHQALRTPGQPLDKATRAFMEPRFGVDFSNVRIHTDPLAASSAKALGAHAYTVGTEMVFSGGQFAPNTASGRRLLAHELSHVVQQGQNSNKSMLRRAPAAQTEAKAD